MGAAGATDDTRSPEHGTVGNIGVYIVLALVFAALGGGGWWWRRVAARRAERDPSADPGARWWNREHAYLFREVVTLVEGRHPSLASGSGSGGASTTTALGWQSAWQARSERALLLDAARLLATAAAADRRDPLARAGLLHVAAEACMVGPRIPCRYAMRKLADPVAAARRDTADDALVLAVAAMIDLRLGHLDQARAAVQALPADQWYACLVRSELYRLDGDEERSQAALTAAAHLAPASSRAGVGRLAAEAGGRARAAGGGDRMADEGSTRG